MAVSEEKTTTPKSTHVSDPALAPFLEPRFDAAEYLNATLPSLSLASRPKSSNAVSLADLSSQTQDLLSQLNAHTTRLSAILTQLTDDILRSGGRLAYEVEVLRGEAFGLTETLTDGLKGDVQKFIPGGISIKTESTGDELKSPTTSQTDAPDAQPSQPTLEEPDETTPEYISDPPHPRHSPLASRDGYQGASLISVSAPEPGTDSASREQKGKEFAASLRTEIADPITGDPEGGMEKAEIRIQALRDLAQVWKGTAEEKARAKFVESLVELAEDKQRELDREKERNKDRGQQRPGRSGSVPKQQQPQQQRGGGFLENLQRIRGLVE
ncbi:unnamed protein product [Alternaria alternata]